MKAIRVFQFGEPEVMRLEETPDLHPGFGQVVVEVKAIGVNPVDSYIRSGMYANKPSLPYSPGFDAAGIVKSVGEGVTRFSINDRVYTAGTISGAYAEETLCSESQLYRLPQKISFAQGAAIHVPYVTAYRALFQKARALPGENLLVHGATGGVGIAAVQIAHASGIRVIGTGGTERGRRLVAEQGANDLLDHNAPDYMEEVLTLTNGNGVDVILEMLANVNLGKDFTMLARGGRVVIIGSRGSIEIDPRDAMKRDAKIMGLSLTNCLPEELSSIHSAIGAGLENGTLRPIIGKEIPLKDAVIAHHAVMESGAYGKIVLVP